MDNIYKVIIVDDEFRICQLIKKLIAWEELNLQFVGMVHNGRDAYEMIKKEQPHIVITDIKMPALNGLDLIDKVRKNNIDSAFIVMSGYKQFEYAHKALKFGIEDYLLKPVNEKELNETLHKVKTDLINKKQSKINQEQLEKVAYVAKQKMHEQCVDILENKPTNISTIDEVNDKYYVNLQDGMYQALILKIDCISKLEPNSKQDDLVMNKIVTIIEHYLKEQVKELIISIKYNLYIYVIINYDKNDTKNIKTIINQLLTATQNYLYAYGEYEITIGLGKEEDKFENTRFSLNSAKQNIENRIILGTGRLISSKEGDSAVNKLDERIVQKYKHKLQNAVDSLSVIQIKKVIGETISEIEKSHHAMGFTYYSVARQMIDIFVNRVELQNEEREIFTSRMLENIEHCYNVEMLKGLLQREMSKYLEFLSSQKINEEYKPIRTAKNYIENNYQNKLTLDDVADIVGLNPVYFSALFKKETGDNFSNYLTNIRIEAAKEMLKITNDTIACIAEKVGYKDTRYFSQTFNKVVGIKPALYRKLYS